MYVDTSACFFAVTSETNPGRNSFGVETGVFVLY